MTIDLFARLRALEEHFDQVEDDADWDATASELYATKDAITEALQRTEATLETNEEEHEQTFFGLQRLLPGKAKTHWRASVVPLREELERLELLLARWRQLAERFYTDRTRENARSFVRVAEKIQRSIAGDWTKKASVVFGAILSDRSGEDAIAYAEAAEEALRGTFLKEGPVIAAAMLSGRSPAEAIDYAKELRGSLAEGPDATDVVVAALVMGSAKEKVVAYVEALRQRGVKSILLATGLLGQRSASETQQLIDTIERDHGLHAEAHERIAAAALLSGRQPKEAIQMAKQSALDLMGEPGDRINAAAILSNEKIDQARALLAAAHGRSAGETTIVAAGLLSDRPAEESIAFVKQVQQQLTGTWKSEALIIAAALLAGHAEDKIHCSFLLDGFLSD